MKIAFVDFDDIKNPLLAAGQATATAGVGKELSKMGHKVTVYSSKYPGFKDRVENGIEYKHVGIETSNIKLNNALFILSAPLTAIRIKDADVIIECFTAPISTLFTPLFTKIPVIALPSMFDADRFSEKYHLPFYLVERFGIKLYKYFLPYSKVDSSKIKKLNPKAIYKIVPQGVGREYFQIKPKKSKYILFLGRFDLSQKGIDLLLESYAKVKKEIGYPLVLAGHGPDGGKIKEIISKLNLENEVSIVGGAYGKKKAKLISEALFCAFPSRQDELSLWMLEAFASGLPLVSFDLPELKWADKNAILKAKPFNTDDYAKLLMKATNLKLNKEMRKSARELASKYSWENVAEQFESFIKEVLRRKN